MIALAIFQFTPYQTVGVGIEPPRRDQFIVGARNFFRIVDRLCRHRDEAEGEAHLLWQRTHTHADDDVWRFAEVGGKTDGAAEAEECPLAWPDLLIGRPPGMVGSDHRTVSNVPLS